MADGQHAQPRAAVRRTRRKPASAAPASNGNGHRSRLYAELCGHALAKAHARSGDAIAIGSYLGGGDSFDRAMAWLAEEYADQNERDYDTLRDAAASGRVAVETGL
jgi:hypothetical protein